ncbi:hypothetical protein B4107_2694 [Bacillus safensis]|nr:hypothetical protein B4107_2694 [Bacillus safensis]
MFSNTIHSRFYVCFFKKVFVRFLSFDHTYQCDLLLCMRKLSFSLLL